MKIDKKYFLILVIASAALITSLFSVFYKQKIAFVRTSEVVNGYEGMKEASNKYQEKVQSWQLEIDSLKKNLQQKVRDYSFDSLKLTTAQLKERKLDIQKTEQEYINFANEISSKANQEDEKMTRGVLTQLNSFIQKYGKEKGYKIIFGTTTSGSLLYAEEAIDITDEVLSEMNSTYKNEN